jgi:hypothetical protein
MKARQLIDNSSYGPDELRVLGEAFDDAWVRLAPTVDRRPEAIEAARLKLAGTILDLARCGNFNPQWLADTAVQLMVSRAARFQS